jgi:glycosyltransferase involved in cell wall biosynthesis
MHGCKSVRVFNEWLLTVKIAVVSNLTWNITNFRLPVIRALREAGHEVVVISPADSYVVRLVEEGIPHLDIFMDCKGVNPFRDLKTFYQLYSLYAQHRFDAVLHYTIKPVTYGGLAARMLGIPAISTVTGLGTVFIKRNWVTRAVCLLYRMSLKRNYRVLFQNNDDRALFLRERLVAEPLTGFVPGSGVDTCYFQPLEVTAKGEGVANFLLVARMLRDKGVGEYVEAARLLKQRYPEVTCRLLGPVDVENNTAISRHVIDACVADGVVEYHPAVDDVRPHLAQASCVVLPSYREGLPRTLLEAGAMGKPLIATDVPGCRDVVVDGVNGLLCRVTDAADLMQKMETFIQMPLAKRQAMGEASRQRVEEHFAEGAVVKTYLELIDGIGRT